MPTNLDLAQQIADLDDWLPLDDTSYDFDVLSFEEEYDL